MPEISTTQLGGTMRLGNRLTQFVAGSENSTIRKLYGNVTTVGERHRHRYEVNPVYVDQLERNGIKFVGKDELGERMIILELDKNGIFDLTQFISTLLRFNIILNLKLDL
jgi:CTP synthase